MHRLPREEHDKLASLSDADKKEAINEQVTRIHMATFSGTVDKPTLEDALARLDALTGKPHPKAAKPAGTMPYSDPHNTPEDTKPRSPDKPLSPDRPHPLIPELVQGAPVHPEPVTGPVTEATVQPSG